MKKITVKPYIISLLVVFFACEETDEPQEPLFPDLNLIQNDSIEATVIAYFLGQTLEAPDSLFQSQLYHLNHLRQTFIDSFSFLDSLKFLPPWEVGKLSLGFDSTSIHQIVLGEYDHFTTILEEYRPDSIIVRSEGLGSVSAHTSFRYHPVYLSEYYQDLPGLRWAEANRYGFYDYAAFPIIPVLHTDSLEYYFHIHGDLFGGASPPQFHRFVYFDSEVSYTGQVEYNDYIDIALDFMRWGN